MASKRVHYNSPRLPVEYPWKADEELVACAECLPWSVEFFFRMESEEPWVREWHAVDCPLVATTE